MVRINRQSHIFAAKILGVDRGTVSDRLDAYAHNCLDDLTDHARPSHHLPFVLRAELEKIVSGAKQSTSYELVESVEKRTGGSTASRMHAAC
jgi:hypothetical protein